MYRKKIFSLLIAFVLIVGIFAGCGTVDSTGGTKKQTEDKKTSTSTKDVASSNEEEMYTLRHLCGDESNFGYDFANREKYPVWTALEELMAEKNLRMEFELISRDQYQVTIQTRMAAATDLPDSVSLESVGTTTSIGLGEAGIIQDVWEIIETYSDGTAVQYYSEDGIGHFIPKATKTEDGKMYWVPAMTVGLHNGEPAVTNQGIKIRGDWLDNVGLPLPETLEEYRQALIAFKEQDANGNGEADEIAVMRIGTSLVSTPAPWFGLVEGSVGVDLANKTVTSPWYQDTCKDYFKFMNQLYNDGVLDPNGDQSVAVASNTISSMHDWMAGDWTVNEIGVEGAEFLPIGPMQAVEGVTPKYQRPHTESAHHFAKMAFTNLAEPEAAAKMIDILCSEKYMELTEWGVEGEGFEIEDGERVSLLSDISADAQKENGNTIGFNLWGHVVFPRAEWGMTIDSGLVGLPDANREHVLKMLEESNDDNTVLSHSAALYAMPTAEQNERISEISTDLNTYLEELSIQLVTGDASLDQWDSYLEDLEELGLDELIAINEERYQRYING